MQNREKETEVLHHRSDCRACHSTNVHRFMAYGNMPLAGGFLKEKDLPNERFFPLDLWFCRDCSLVQVMDAVNPDVLFRDYRYLSSIGLSGHFTRHAEQLLARYGWNEKTLCVEIGSNDGVLQQPLKERGVRCVGIEPSKNVGQVAKDKGLAVRTEYFTEKNAKKLAEEEGQADAVLANNVLAHIDDMDDVLAGIRALLKPDGVLVLQVHYIADLVEAVQFDTVYHEHLCYYSLKALQTLLGRYGLHAVHVDRIPIHSGSVSVHAAFQANKALPPDASVSEMLAMEKEKGLHVQETYDALAKKAGEARAKIREMLDGLKKQGKRIAGYGAAGRGVILLNYTGIGKETLDYIVDESPERIGRLMPGVHVPIVGPEHLRENPPDYLVLVAWSYADMIKGKTEWFAKRGGKYILPLPEPRVDA